MRLSAFILKNMGSILAEWDGFAATLMPAAHNMTRAALRDHAQQILEAVARDLTTAQTAEQQAQKSRGRAPSVPGSPETAAQTHAVLRARSGFDINQLVAEYRALRASVLRLWTATNPMDELGVQELTRFNEAIDQAIAESVGHFHKQTERARNLLLGMLGHDMRTPLSAIITTASHLSALNAGDEISSAANRLVRSGASIQGLLNDLVDFNRTQFGLGIKVVSSEIDLASEIADELEQLRAAHPNRRFEFTSNGDAHGRWDGARLKQVLRNLVSNAVRYGYADSTVDVELLGAEDEVLLKVTNRGETIAPLVGEPLFDPLKRGLARAGNGDALEGLGLGLFIVREIVDAHGGKVGVHSDGEETTFTVRLPRERESQGAQPGSG